MKVQIYDNNSDVSKQVTYLLGKYEERNKVAFKIDTFASHNQVFSNTDQTDIAFFIYVTPVRYKMFVIIV